MVRGTWLRESLQGSKFKVMTFWTEPELRDLENGWTVPGLPTPEHQLQKATLWKCGLYIR